MEPESSMIEQATTALEATATDAGTIGLAVLAVVLALVGIKIVIRQVRGV